MPIKEALIEKRGARLENILIGVILISIGCTYTGSNLLSTQIFFGTEEVIYKKYNHDAISKKKIGT